MWHNQDRIIAKIINGLGQGTAIIRSLRTIDYLWVKYSNGRFGFSVQKRIWQSVGGQPGVYDYDIYKKFGDTVGWREKDGWLIHSDLTFSLNAPQGHLPQLAERLSRGLFSRAKICKM